MGLFSGASNFLFGSDPVQSKPIYDLGQQARDTAAAYKTREQEDYQRQLEFSKYLTQVLTGVAPSLANMQMHQGMDAITAGILSNTAGVAGPGAGLAQYNAASLIPQQQTQLNNQTAQLRAQEQGMARDQLGGLYSGVNKLTGSLSTAGDVIGADYTKTGAGIDQANRQAEQQENAALMQALGGAGALYFGGRR